MNAQISIKGAIMARRRRDLARFYRKLEWFRIKIAVRRIERGWFKERAFRNRVMVCWGRSLVRVHPTIVHDLPDPVSSHCLSSPFSAPLSAPPPVSTVHPSLVTAVCYLRGV